MFKSYTDVRDWLENFIPQTWTKSELGLERISYLLKLLGNPQNKFKSIHIAGTSGKGSTAFYIARLLALTLGYSQTRDQMSFQSTEGPWPAANGVITRLRAPSLRKQLIVKGQVSNVKIGLHISPHLSYIGERMQIFYSHSLSSLRKRGSKILDQVENDNTLMSMKRFLGLFNEIKLVVEVMQKEKPDLTPSYFEILVAASFLYFAQEKVDWAVVEVGLGGRLDATNILKPEICVITNVGLDHTEILGETIEKITLEKAGIIKQRTPVVTGTVGKTLEVIEKIARAQKAPLIKVNTQLGLEPLKSDIKDYLKKYYDIDRYISKHFALPNFLLALTTVLALGFRPTCEAVEKLSKEVFQGRFEEVEPGVILDGAHNPDKIKALLEFIGKSKVKSQKSKVILVLGFKKGKAWKKMIDLLIKNLPVIKVIATQFQTPTDTGFFEAVKPREISNYIKSVYSLPTTVYGNSQEAVFESLDARRLDSNQLILVTGSLYLVGEARTLWYLPEF